MVPPLANTFASTFNPTVTSALVDNLINNNSTPTTLSSVTPTSVISSGNVGPQTSSGNICPEMNANTSAIDTLAANTASQLFVSPSDQLIRTEQQSATIQPPSSLPAMYQTPTLPPNQNQGEFFKLYIARHEFKSSFLAEAPAAQQYNVPMYNMNQFNNYPMQQPSEAQQKVEQAFASPPMTNFTMPDANSNPTYQPASSQFNMPQMPSMQTFEAYPQVQTQINLQGLPPLTVNTRIDPTKYS